MFSPHTRGCSAAQRITPTRHNVFPAYAGMFLLPNHPPPGSRRFPRIRGDVPALQVEIAGGFLFSPHTRGCSRLGHRLACWRCVFPAYAGMFPRSSGNHLAVCGFPRIRGDVPSKQARDTRVLRFSPHTRGCSPRSNRRDPLRHVFPAYAGMFP